MLPVVYITPNFTPNAVKFIDALTSLHDIKIIILSQEPVTLLPNWQQSRVSISQQLPDVFNSDHLISGLREIQKITGPFHRVIGATEQLQVPIAEVREAFKIDGMDSNTANNFRDKSQMKYLLDKAGIPCARHSMVHNVTEAFLFAETCPYPFVLKPVEGAGSQTTYRVNNATEMKAAFERMETAASRGILIEEFIKGDEYSLDTFTLNGKHLLQTINQYFPTPLEVMNQSWIQWRVILKKEITGSEFDDIRTFGERTLKILGMKTGMSHMEWFRRSDGSVAISEVAARPPGAQFMTLISRACDFDAIKAWVRLMIYNESNVSPLQYSSGAAYLRGPGHGKITHTSGLEQIRSKYNHIITDVRIPKPGQIKSSSYEGDGYIIVRHKETAVVEQALNEIVNTIRVHYEFAE